ncbi:hypothetical protein Fmac_021554 [Flemingia macrophylla]|uniref:Uncharacterized protein n=1 Tax=Flemingia macrophylla TaxID=520843 RepID=A0ABD1LXF5_9FABA
MGNTSAAQVCILALIMFSTFFFMTLQARSLHGYHHKQVVDIHNLLHDLSKHAQVQVASLPLAPADRLAPGGPDPQHNARAPPH